MTSQITIVGNLTKDPELRFTPSGKAVCNLTVAVNERVKNAAGDWEDGEGTFYEVAVWEGYAENVAESLTKGMRVIVCGGLKGRRWEGRDGAKGTSLDILVDRDGGVGPDLRWATANVTRTQRANGNGAPQGQPQGQPAYAGAPQGGGQPVANDPWATDGGVSDEPPF